MKKIKNYTASIMAATALVAGVTTLASAAPLYRQLQFGMTGSDVGSLQSFLAIDPSVYPEAKVTNYFGSLTRAAVMRFQAKNGIATVGRVGPQTMGVINAQMAGGVTSSNGTAPSISVATVSQGNTYATVNWTTNEPARGVVYYSTSPLSTYENDNSVTINGNTAQTDTSLRQSQSVSISNLTPNTTYYYMVYVTDSNGNVSVTVPSTFRTNN